MVNPINHIKEKKGGFADGSKSLHYTDVTVVRKGKGLP
jgi:hypothetical protein